MGRAWLKLLAVVATVLVVDQLTKQAALSAFDVGQSSKLFPGVELTLSYNSGVAFGWFSGGKGVVTTVASLLIVGALLLLFVRSDKGSPMWLQIGLLIGGAVANLIDRVSRGEVVDFIDVLGWPTFNIADMAIVIGALLLAITYLRDETSVSK